MAVGAACAHGQAVGLAAVTPGVVTEFAGQNASLKCVGAGVTPVPASPYDGCPPAYINVSGIKAIVFDSIGNMYFSDANNHRIRKITPAGVVSTIAGNGTSNATVGVSGATLGDNGPATSAVVTQASALAIDSSGNIYFSDYDTNRVRVVYEAVNPTLAALIALENPGITATVGDIYTIAGTGAFPAVATPTDAQLGDGGLATSALFGNSSNVSSSNGMGGVAVDGSGNVYIDDATNDVVRKVNATTGIISLYAGTLAGSGTFTNGGVATAVPIGLDRGLVANAAGDLFIMGGDMYMVNGPNTTATTPGLGFGYAPGTIHIVAGGGGYSGYAGPYNTLGPLSRFGSARQITMDPAGDLYNNDNTYLRITKLDVNDIITLVAGNSAQLNTFTNADPPVGLGGPATSAELGMPVSGAISPLTGDLYIADSTNNVIYDVSASSSILAFGSQATYVDSAAQTAIVSNVSTGVLHFSGLAFSATTPFTQVPSGKTDCSSSTVLQPGQSCEIAVVFTPTAVGAATGTITITDDSTGTPGTTQTISLTGTGTTTASKTTLTATPTTVSAGGSTVLKAVVTASVGSGSPATAPTGSVAFYNGATLLGSGNLDLTGTATYPLSGLSPATYNNITAQYTTDGTYLSSTSAAATVTFVGTAATATALSVTSQTITVGESVTFTATVTSAAGTPTGTVTFYNNTTVLGTGAVTLLNGVASYTTTTLAAGYAPISAVYTALGGLIYTTSTSPTVGVLVSANAWPVGSLIPGILSTFAGTAGTAATTGTSTGDGGAASAALLNGPTRAAFDAAGNLYIVDAGDNTIRKIAATYGAITASSTISVLSGAEAVAGAAVGNATTAARYQSPQGIAFDLSGNLYVADSLNNAVRKIAASSGSISSTSTVTSIAGAQVGLGTSYTGAAFSAGYTGDGGLATAATLNAPRDVAVDKLGNIFIADYGNNVVRMINGTGTTATTPGFAFGYAAGVIHTVAGSGRITSSAYAMGDGGPATQATFNQIAGVAVDINGNLYISDSGNSEVRVVSPTTGIIKAFAGTAGSAGYSGDGAAATSAQLSSPGGLSFDIAGNLYIADTGNSVVRQVGLTGNIQTVAGTGVSGGTGDAGPSTSAELTAPVDAVPDGRGNLYIVDKTLETVRQVNGQASALVFPEEPESTNSPAESFQVTNPGGQPLTLTGLTISSTVFTQSTTGTGNCTSSTVLAAGTSCVISIVGNSSAQTTNMGTVTVTDNSLGTPGKTQTASLSMQTVYVPTQTITFPTVGPLTYGVSPVTLTATASSNLPVSYKVVSGPGTLNGNVLTVTGAGSIMVTASQAGVPLVYYPATSVTQTIVVNQAPLTFTATSFSQSTGIAIGALNYTVSGYANNDTAATAYTGTPSLTTTATSSSPNGQYPITITQGTLASTNYSFVFVNGTVTLAGAPQFITFNQPAPVTYSATPVTLTASSTSGLTVTFTVVSGPATVSGNLLTLSGAGAVVIQANQAGNYNQATNTGYGTAVVVQQTLTVNPAPLTVNVNSASKAYGSANPTLTGTVAGTVGSDVLTPTYSTTATVASTPGPYPITAMVTGANIASYTVTVNAGTLTVTTATPQVLLSVSSAAIAYGSNDRLTATVTSSSGVAPGGSITFYAGTTQLNNTPAQLLNGSASVTTAAIPAGVQAITAHYSGDSNYALTISAAMPVDVQASTTTVVTTSALDANLATPITFTAVVTPQQTSNATPGGTISFYDTPTGGTTTLLGTMNATSNATAGTASATLTVSNLPLNTTTIANDNITATYTDTLDNLFGTSTSAAVSEVISQEFVLTLQPSSTTTTPTVTIQTGQNAQLQGSLVGNNGFSQPVVLTCSGAPANVGCSFSASTITPTEAGVNFNMFISTAAFQTTAQDRRGPRPGARNQGGGVALAMLLLGLGGLGARRRAFARALGARGWQRMLLMPIAAAALAGATALSGCGSSYVHTENVAPGTSTITVTGTSGSVSYSQTFTLVITAGN